MPHLPATETKVTELPAPIISSVGLRQKLARNLGGNMSVLVGGGTSLLSRFYEPIDPLTKEPEPLNIANETVVPPTPTTDPYGTALEQTHSRDRGRDESLQESHEDDDVGAGFHINRAVRDARREEIFAKRALALFEEVGDTVAQTIEAAKNLSSEISFAGGLAHRTVEDIPSLGAISSSIATLRESLVSGEALERAASAASTPSSVGVTNGRSDHVLSTLSVSAQRELTPPALTFNDLSIRSTLEVTRSDLGVITHQLRDIEARLVAQCSITPFGNGDELTHLNKLRLVMDRIEGLDSFLGTLQPVS